MPCFLALPAVLAKEQLEMEIPSFSQNRARPGSQKLPLNGLPNGISLGIRKKHIRIRVNIYLKNTNKKERKGLLVLVEKAPFPKEFRLEFHSGGYYIFSGKQTCYYSRSQVGWYFQMLFQSSKLKTWASLVPRFSKKRRSSGYFSRTRFGRSRLVVKTLLYCSRKCCCKGGCMWTSLSFLSLFIFEDQPNHWTKRRPQPPRNGSTGQVPVLSCFEKN